MRRAHPKRLKVQEPFDDSLGVLLTFQKVTVQTRRLLLEFGEGADLLCSFRNRLYRYRPRNRWLRNHRLFSQGNDG